MNNVWILILTITSQYGVAINQTGQEFYGKEACMQAATLWLKQTRKMMYVTEATALCVPQYVKP